MILSSAADLPTAGLVISVLRLDLLAKLALAVLLGGTVGLERELSGKPAGLRTNILICVGSAMLMDLSVRIGITETGARVGDPARLAAQVVSGIGFLGAGTILQARGTVVGLTTAATIWVVAAIGLTIGSGSYLEALGATLLVATVLWGLGRVEKRLLQTRRVIGGTLRVLPRTPFDELEQIFNSAGIQVLQKTVYEHTDDRTYELKLMGPARQYDIISAALMRRSDVLSAQFD
ncbi:MAG TPA: MgtC/SapB family protein [Gemmatimonadaceae bacterium]|nr:MgtC/SapB family protein [Gemmatimonadaceae bacterium]